MKGRKRWLDLCENKQEKTLIYEYINKYDAKIWEIHLITSWQGKWYFFLIIFWAGIHCYAGG